MDKNVVAILVTYNSADLLAEAIRGVNNQSYPVSKVIVIDNASDENNKKRIKELEIRYNLDVVYLEENTGGAGGFETGMRYAHKHYKPDWYWLMDDDACPRKKCLENLLKWTNNDSIGFLAPLIYGKQLAKYQLYHHKFKTSLLLSEKSVTNDMLDRKNIKIDANAFVGVLISSNAVNEVGFADGSLFIYGDDTEYTFRVSQKLKGFLITNAIIDHRDVVGQSSVNATWWWKEYYMYRNRFFFIKKYQSFPKVIVSLIFLITEIIKKLFASLIKPAYKGYRLIRIKLLFKCVIDGLANRRGKVIDPKSYINMINNR